tara:strand:- start:1281 stop:1925 length:645 start_codon:yes stop_codon:yes gene_type:complete
VSAKRLSLLLITISCFLSNRFDLVKRLLRITRIPASKARQTFELLRYAETGTRKVGKVEIEEGCIVEGKVVRLEEYGIYLDVNSREVLVPIIFVSWYPPIDHRKMYPVGTLVRALIFRKVDNDHFGGSIKHVGGNPYGELQHLVGATISATVRSCTRPNKVEVLVGKDNTHLRLPIGTYTGDLGKGKIVSIRILSIDKRFGYEGAEAELVEPPS